MLPQKYILTPYNENNLTLGWAYWQVTAIHFYKTDALPVDQLIPMTHAPETGAINRLHFLAPDF